MDAAEHIRKAAESARKAQRYALIALVCEGVSVLAGAAVIVIRLLGH